MKYCIRCGRQHTDDRVFCDNCGEFLATYEQYYYMVQYYYQKGNLVTRDANGSHIEKIDESARVETLSRIFDLSPELISRALGILSK